MGVSSVRLRAGTTPSDLRRALWRILAFIFIAGGCAVIADVCLGGPLQWFLWEVSVVRPVEARWGFHAERRQYGAHELLTIVEVTPGGAFDRAGIKPGYVYNPRTGSVMWPTPRFHRDLDEAGDEQKILLYTDPSNTGSGRIFVVRRQAAAT